MSRKKNQARREQKAARTLQTFRNKFSTVPGFATNIDSLDPGVQLVLAGFAASLPGTIVSFGSSTGECCPQPEAQGAEADPRSAGDLGHERAAVGNTADAGEGRKAARHAAPAPPAAARKIYIQFSLSDECDLIPFDPDAHRVPKHPPSRQRVPSCDCVDCTGRPRLNLGWKR